MNKNDHLAKVFAALGAIQATASAPVAFTRHHIEKPGGDPRVARFLMETSARRRHSRNTHSGKRGKKVTLH